MRVSTKGRYALRMMVDIASAKDGEFISLRDISERQHLSMKYMEQIVSRLSKAGYLYSVRGPQGGYRLSRPTSEYRIGDILRVTEGELALVRCLDCNRDFICIHNEGCVTKPLWKEIQNRILEYVDSVTLQQLIDGELES